VPQKITTYLYTVTLENRVLRRTFGPKTDEVTGGWRKLHNEELHNLHCSPSIIRMNKSRRMRWAGHVASMEAKRNAYMILMRKPEGNRPLGRPRRRWEGNIKRYLRERVWGGMDWDNLSKIWGQWNALMNTVLNLRIS
jgi:hypothetical protein